MYKVGDIIAYTDFEDDFLCEITDVHKLDFDEDHQTFLNLKVLYKNIQPVDITHGLYLPKDDHVIRTKEEYFEIAKERIYNEQTEPKQMTLFEEESFG